MANIDPSTVMYSQKNTPQTMLYASPRFAISIFMGIIDFSLFFLYTEVYQLNSLLTGIALGAGKVAIALSQFFFGWISDHTNTRLGRRKPYFIIMSPLLTFSYILLLLPRLVLGTSPETSLLFLWLIVFNCLSQALYAVTTVYQSWTAELFPSQQRPVVSAFQNGFNFTGVAIVTLFNMLVLTGVKRKLEERPDVIPPEFLYTVFVFAILLVSLFYLVTFLMPIEQTPRYTSKLIEDLKVIIKNKNLIAVNVLQGICSFAWAMISALILGFVDLVLKIRGTTYILVAAAMILGMIMSLAFWVKHMRKHGKEKTLQRVFLLGIIITPLTLLGFFGFSTSLFFALPFIIAIAVALGGWYLFPYIMYADIAEDDLYKTGQLKAGIYTGFPALILNAFQAVSLFFTGFIVDIGKKTDSLPDTFGYLIWGPIASIILIISLIYAKKLIKLDFKGLS